MQYRHWGKGAHMSADLKATTARVRARHPEYFVEKVFKQKNFDADGKVIESTLRVLQATAMSGAARHAISTKRD